MQNYKKILHYSREYINIFCMKKHLANLVTGTWIVSWIIACILVIRGESSWMIAQFFLFFSLITDGLDGKVARKYGSTTLWPILDDVADFINFWVHPGIWIYFALSSPLLASISIIAVAFRLIRFTLYAQNTTVFFSGLPSPASAVAIFWIIFLSLDSPLYTSIFIIMISIFTISHIPFVHLFKYPLKYQWTLLFSAIILWIISFLWGQTIFSYVQCLWIICYTCISLFIYYTRTHDSR